MTEEERLAPLRIEAHPLPRALHVRARNVTGRPLELYFKRDYLWRLTLVDRQGRVRTYHLKDPVRRLYWSRHLEPGQWVEATFSGLPRGTFDARVDFFALWCDPLYLKDVTF